MTEDQWKEAWEAFRATRETGAEEPANPSGAIHDPEVLRHIESMLAEVDEPSPEPGQVYGRYRIIAKVGRGGMGEVYTAQDTDLNRTVALKFVAKGKLGTAGLVEQFIHEAQSASALNHPGIVTVHEVIRSGATVAIAMELVDGVSFRTLCGKPHTAAEVADWGRKAAQALAVAHAARIVHRDIKPDNLMLRPDNLVKILDFGIARNLSDPDSLDGIPLGTLGYMAPEQIAGAALTPSADIFSLGIVLYELSTGTHPFLSESAMETTHAIALLDPKPPRIGRPLHFGRGDLGPLIHSMLAKDPSRRPAANVVALRLEKISRRRESRRQWRALAASLLVVGLAAAAWWAVYGRQAARAPQPVIKQFNTLTGTELQPSFSPDGRRVAFSWDGVDGANRDIYVQNVDGDTPVRLTTDPRQDTNPVWSPDGTHIAFLRKSPTEASHLVMVRAAQGGEERTVGRITEYEFFYAPLAWWPDGGSLIVREASHGAVGFLRLMLDTGEKRPLTVPSGTSRDSNAAVSPDGRRFAFIRHHGSTFSSICVAPLGEREENAAKKGIDKAECFFNTGDLGAIVWWHGGKEILYSSGGALFRIAPGPNAERRQTNVTDGGFQDLVADREGRRLAGVRASGDSNIWRVDRNGEERVKLIASSREESDADYSPDGERIVFRSTRSGNLDLWVAGKDGSNPTRITNFGSSLGSARWSPDGRQIAFDGWGPKFEHTRNTNIYVVDATGGPMRRLTDDQAIYGVPNWSHDGRWIYFMKRLGSAREAWKIPATGGTAVQVSSNMMFDVAESADGQYLYYTTQLAAGGIWRRRVDGGEPTLLRGTERVQRYRYWELAPKGVYFVEGPADPVVQFLDFKTNRVTRLASLSPQLLLQRGLSVSPDGKFFLYGQDDARQSNLYLIDGVQ